MRTVKLIALGSALALAGTMLALSTDRASALPRALPTVATRTVSVDVDGDRADDVVTVEQSATDAYVVTVVTAAGGDAVMAFTSTIEGDWGVEPWYGAARLDHSKGYELLLLTSGGDGLMFRVLTWRSGALVWERAPKALMKGTYDWYLATMDWARFGYRLTTTDGHRYVRDFELYRSGSHWKGTIVKSVWKVGAWKKVSTVKVNLTRKQAKHYKGLSGVTLVAQP